MQDNRIKVLKFLTNFNIGGTERQFVEIVQRMDLDRFDVHIGCFARTGGFLPLVESKGMPLEEFNIRRLYSPATWLRQCEFARYLYRERFQVVHSYGFYPNIFAVPAARLAGVPVVIASIRDTGEVLANHKRRLQKRVCALATRVLANADAVRRRLILDGYDEGKVGVIRNGVGLFPLERRRDDGPIRRELGIPPGSPLVAVLSRLNRLKGIRYLLDALPAVLSRCPHARILILGDGADRADLEAHAARMALGNAVVFTGFRLDVADILKEVSISVLPSLSEGLSNALIESMAAGVAVVATRVGGNPEVVDDGVSGLLVSPGDSVALAGAITGLLEDGAAAMRMGDAGRLRIESRFSLERAVRETQELYTYLLENPAHLAQQAGAV